MTMPFHHVMSAATTIVFILTSFAEADCRALGTGMDILSCEPKTWRDDGNGGQVYTDNPNYKCDLLCNDDEWDPLSCEPKTWQEDGHGGRVYTPNPKYKGERFCNDDRFKHEVDWDLLDMCLTRGMVLSEIDNECHHLATR